MGKCWFCLLVAEAIIIENLKKNRLLALQAKPMIEKGNAKELLDPNIAGTFDEDQFHKMVLAATHCLTRAATYRPNIKEVSYSNFGRLITEF